MNFKRRPLTSAAHGYSSLRTEEDKHPGLDVLETSSALKSHSRSDADTGSAGSSMSAPECRPQPDHMRVPHSRGPNGAPRGQVWEQSFAMSPEVRFTRTPERVLKERRRQFAP